MNEEDDFIPKEQLVVHVPAEHPTFSVLSIKEFTELVSKLPAPYDWFRQWRHRQYTCRKILKWVIPDDKTPFDDLPIHARYEDFNFVVEPPNSAERDYTWRPTKLIIIK